MMSEWTVNVFFDRARPWVMTSLLLLASHDLSAEQDLVKLGAAKLGTVNLGATIIGNQEQPRVLYLLPWQEVDAQGAPFVLWQRQSYGIFDHVPAGFGPSGWRDPQQAVAAGRSADRSTDSVE
jgi:hypothetical protein